MRDAHAWKFDNVPPPAPKDPRQIRGQFKAEVREIMKRRIMELCKFNSVGAEEAKGHLRAALGEIERLA